MEERVKKAQNGFHTLLSTALGDAYISTHTHTHTHIYVIYLHIYIY